MFQADNLLKSWDHEGSTLFKRLLTVFFAENVDYSLAIGVNEPQFKACPKT